MRIRAYKVREGPQLGQIVIAVITADRRKETVIIDQHALKDGTIDVGRPIGRAKDRVLVELPRQTTSGIWRVWISGDVAVKELDLLFQARATT